MKYQNVFYILCLYVSKHMIKNRLKNILHYRNKLNLYAVFLESKINVNIAVDILQ